MHLKRDEAVSNVKEKIGPSCLVLSWQQMLLRYSYLLAPVPHGVSSVNTV